MDGLVKNLQNIKKRSYAKAWNLSIMRAKVDKAKTCKAQNFIWDFLFRLGQDSAGCSARTRLR